MTAEEWMHKIYYDESNYVGVSELYRLLLKRNVNIRREQVSKWLKEQETSKVTKADVGKSKTYLPIYSDVPYSFRIDLTFFPRYVKQNKGYSILFTAININTRYVYAYIVKDKTMDAILDVIKQMEEKTPINSFTSDYGGEFYNKVFRQFCKEKGITNYFIKDDSHKLGIINRFHRTLKEKLTKYFYANDTVEWIHAIKKIVHNYNRTFNRGIGATPFDVENDPILEQIILSQKKAVTGIVKDSTPEFSVGDTVLYKRKQVLFEDKMLGKYYSKRYRIIKITANSATIVDSSGKEQIVKKSQLMKVNNDVVEDEEVVPPRRFETVMSLREQAKRRVPKSDVDINNVVEGKRIRKAKQY